MLLTSQTFLVSGTRFEIGRGCIFRGSDSHPQQTSGHMEISFRLIRRPKGSTFWAGGSCLTPNPINLLTALDSDGVLNPSGIRFGSSEIYSILSTPQFTPFIVDSCVVGQQRVKPPYSDAAEQVVLFIKCAPTATTNGLKTNPEVETKIREQIAKDLSRRHVPTFVFEAPEIPYNTNGKKLEIQVKAVLCGGREALAKMKITKEERQSLEWFEKFYHIEREQQRSGRRTGKL